MFRFYEILDSKDHRYLLEEYEDVVIDEKLKGELSDCWNDLFREYIDLKDDTTIKQSFKQLALISKLEKKLNVCSKLLECLGYQSTRVGQVKLMKELAAWGFSMDRRKPLEDEVSRIFRSLKSLKSNILIKKAAFQETHKKEATQEKLDLDRDIVNVEQALGGGKNIDPDRTMMSKWVAMVRKAKEPSKSVI
jgi:hypothetical protein